MNAAAYIPSIRRSRIHVVTATYFFPSFAQYRAVLELLNRITTLFRGKSDQSRDFIRMRMRMRMRMRNHGSFVVSVSLLYPSYIIQCVSFLLSIF